MKKISSLLLALPLAACSGIEISNDEEIKDRRSQKYDRVGSLMGGEGGIVFGRDRRGNNSGNVGIGVNAHLWRATLDALSFMPLKSADPFGGVILTDWYTNPEVPNERIKVDIAILDTQLRADGLRVSVFRQVLKGQSWTDMPQDATMAQALEDTILTKARNLRAKE